MNPSQHRVTRVLEAVSSGDTEAASEEACSAGRRAYKESKFMKFQQLSFVAAIAAATFTIGCTTTGTTATAPRVAMRGAADAVIHIRGLSCPF